MHDRRSRRLAAPRVASLVLAAGFAAFPFASPPSLFAQAGLPHVDDATTAPRGFLRLRVLTAWTRSDARFSADSIEPLGAPFTADAFGADKFAPLGTIQSLVQAASAMPFTLTMGRARLDATAREEVIPLALEYGVTSRLAVSVTMPVVRKRVAALFRLDTAGGFGANVGPNLHRTSASALQTNESVQTQFSDAITQLQDRLASGALAGREAEAQQLIQSSQSFASTVATLYGSAASTGMAFVPLGTSAAQAEVAARISSFNAQFRDLLASSTDLILAVPRGAGGIAGVSEFQRYLTEDLGGDSVVSQERVGIGDVEIGFKFRVLDRPPTQQRRTGLQVAIASALRLPTGSRESVTEAADLRLGEGSVVVDSRAIVDARFGRVGLLAIGQFAASVHDVDTTNMTQRNSRWTDIHLAPRWHLSEPFSLHAAYSLRSTDKLGSEELIGGGVSFTTLGSRRGSATPPIEMRFTHLEAVRGDEGRRKFFRDQVEIRVYYRLLGR